MITCVNPTFSNHENMIVNVFLISKILPFNIFCILLIKNVMIEFLDHKDMRKMRINTVFLST